MVGEIRESSYDMEVDDVKYCSKTQRLQKLIYLQLFTDCFMNRTNESNRTQYTVLHFLKPYFPSVVSYKSLYFSLIIYLKLNSLQAAADCNMVIEQIFTRLMTVLTNCSTMLPTIDTSKMGKMTGVAAWSPIPPSVKAPPLWSVSVLKHNYHL